MMIHWDVTGGQALKWRVQKRQFVLIKPPIMPANGKEKGSQTHRVVAREILVPDGICGNSLWHWQFYWKLPKFDQFMYVCDSAIFDTWVLGAGAWIVY